jgi:hypothetical protein
MIWTQEVKAVTSEGGERGQGVSFPDTKREDRAIEPGGNPRPVLTLNEHPNTEHPTKDRNRLPPPQIIRKVPSDYSPKKSPNGQ